MGRLVKAICLGRPGLSDSLRSILDGLSSDVAVERIECEGVEACCTALRSTSRPLSQAVLVEVGTKACDAPEGLFTCLQAYLAIQYPLGTPRPALYFLHRQLFRKAGRDGAATDLGGGYGSLQADLQDELALDGPAAALKDELATMLAQRSPLEEPQWLIDLIAGCFAHPPPDQDFPAGAPGLDLLALASSRSFSPTGLSSNDLLALIYAIFDASGLLDQLDIDRPAFQRYLLALRLNYKSNPYHNFQHAVDVLQFAYLLVEETPAFKALLSPLERFALFFAAISHDLGHTSFNNRFHVQAESLLALLYNDQSVLENYHCLLIFAILRHPEYNFCRRWHSPGDDRWKAFRRLAIAAILGTDMAVHFDYVKRIAAVDWSAPSLDSAARTLLAVAIIKCADISNIVRPFDVARQWGFKLVCEFFHQGDWEQTLGHPLSPMNDRAACDLARGQEHFMLQVAGPLFQTMAQAFPPTAFCTTELQANVERWRHWTPEADDLLAALDDLRPCLLERSCKS